MARMPGVPFKPPRSWTAGRPLGPPRFVVIHYTAGSEQRTAAEDGVSYDARRTDGTSAHFYTDRDSIIQCVDTANRSHTALWNGNCYGIHIEQCGTRQTREQWLDEASRPTIRNTARVCAWAMQAHDIPLARLVSRQVRSGRGICGHIDCTTGFPEDDGTHEDPGTAYPWDVLFQDIRDIQGGDDMATGDEVWAANIGSTSLGIPPKPAADWLKGIEVASRKIDAIAAQLGVVIAEVDTLEESDAQILIAVAAIQAGDPDALADAIVAKLGPAQAQAMLDAMSARLAG